MLKLPKNTQFSKMCWEDISCEIKTGICVGQTLLLLGWFVVPLCGNKTVQWNKMWNPWKLLLFISDLFQCCNTKSGQWVAVWVSKESEMICPCSALLYCSSPLTGGCFQSPTSSQRAASEQKLCEGHRERGFRTGFSDWAQTQSGQFFTEKTCGSSRGRVMT